jgi:hypothetical protein
MHFNLPTYAVLERLNVKGQQAWPAADPRLRLLPPPVVLGLLLILEVPTTEHEEKKHRIWYAQITQRTSLKEYQKH